MTWMQDVRDGNLRRERSRTGYNGWWNLAIAIGYGVAENCYFGWNLTPKSGAEMACDGIALLLVIVTSRHLAQQRSGSGHE